jgi:hypothetical protein
MHYLETIDILVVYGEDSPSFCNKTVFLNIFQDVGYRWDECEGHRNPAAQGHQSKEQTAGGSAGKFFVTEETVLE